MYFSLYSFNIYLIVTNRDIFTTFIPTQPHLNIVCSSRVKDLVELWETTNLTTSFFTRTTPFIIPEKIICIQFTGALPLGSGFPDS